MNGVNISVKMIDNTDMFKAAKDAALEQACEMIGLLCESSVKAKTPVGTPESTGIDGYHGGTLRNSITHTVKHEGNEYKAIIGTNIHYAPYVELGTGKYATNGNGRKTRWAWRDVNGKLHWTSGMQPRHFMKNGVEENKPMFAQIIQSCLQG